ncbi:MAG: hypothetical protein LUG91_02820 [Ruminococcus sp.]|nr:hypothetical protein [Ruminococcus sp.]
MSSFFIIYAVFGWCLEVIYEAVEQGKFINRGFLNGPYCPIYGFGVIIVILCLNPIKDNILILYFGSVILTSALEFFTGFILEKIFHQKWWDYSDLRFNLKSYICLKFSLLWGVACLIVVTIIHPLIERFVNWIPHTLGVVILIILFAGFFSDVVITAFGIMHIKKRLRILDNISAEMRKISDVSGEMIYGAVAGIREKSEVISDKNDAVKARFDELKAKYKAEYEKKSSNRKRIEKAFPRLKINSGKSLKEIFEEFKNNEK